MIERPVSCSVTGRGLGSSSSPPKVVVVGSDVN